MDKKGLKGSRFKDNIPEIDWLKSFLNRHKDELKIRLNENIKRVRVAVDEETLQIYFEELNVSPQGVPPEGIINYDETNVCDDPGKKKVTDRSHNLGHRRPALYRLHHPGRLLVDDDECNEANVSNELAQKEDNQTEALQIQVGDSVDVKFGLPIKRHTLCETIKDIITEDLEMNANRKVPFKDNKPGRRWFESFMKRHPAVSERYAEGINRARANVTEDKIRNWFSELHDYLKEENALDILEDPSRMFNADESGFLTCPKTGKVLGPISYKNLYEIKSGNEKEAIIVLANFSACGSVAPPMVVFPLQGISKDIAAKLNETWEIG
ncbi:hypothetical protein ANN_15645 [Periplaneta americana]|uniref:HTH CENPB-type domain-containing protein n=1 Tax=Periplaneta americana TaxID=6978 RepID=A0ABQ8SI62_PERAM|nr:hypothetical protein ANN_15645 [Periplaneta americana]